MKDELKPKKASPSISPNISPRGQRRNFFEKSKGVNKDQPAKSASNNRHSGQIGAAPTVNESHKEAIVCLAAPA